MTKLANATIPVEDAIIQERQVAIQVLTIGTKQVTQALYKQLPIENVRYDKTGLLRGKVWGWVNIHGEKLYYMTNCADDKHHLHVIWEADGQLKRSAIHRYHDSVGNIYTHLEQAYEESYQTCLAAGQLFIAVSGVWK